MIRVEVLGAFGLSLDEVERGHTVPRRLASILAIIALHDARGVSRERLLELLWTDTEPERARHALTQSLYALRRLLGRDDAIVGTAQLQLAAELVQTDIAELERAMQEGHGERVSELYRGELLDGLVVSGAPELERWLEARRAELRRQVARALDTAAAVHSERGAGAAAVALLRRRVALDPLDGSATMQLMRALAAVGDAPGAMQNARVYGALVRQELDLEPDARVEALAVELVARAGEVTPGSSGTAVSGAPRTSWRERVRATVHTWSPSSQTRRTMRQAAVAAVAGVAALLMLAHFGDQRARRETPGASTVVLPFRGTALSPDLAYLPAAVVELLSVALAAHDTLPVVDPAVVHTWWSRRDPSPVPAESLVAAAYSLGAGQVVTGTLVGDARLLVIRATVRDRRPGGVMTTVVVRGPLDSLPELVDDLARRLTHDQGVMPAVDHAPPRPDSVIER